MKKEKLLLDLNKVVEEHILTNKKILVLYFDYKYTIKNIFTSPLFLLTKGLAKIKGRRGLDHTCHISKVIYNDELNIYDLILFEANWNKGMIFSKISDRIKKYNVKIYYSIIDKKDNLEKKHKFEKKYLHSKYSSIKAFLSGIDLLADDTIKTKKNPKTLFCSMATAMYLKDQGVDISNIESGNSREITPSDLWHGLNEEKKLLIES